MHHDCLHNHCHCHLYDWHPHIKYSTWEWTEVWTGDCTGDTGHGRAASAVQRPLWAQKMLLIFYFDCLLFIFYCCYVSSFCCSSGKVAGPSTMPAMNWGKDAVGSPRLVWVRFSKLYRGYMAPGLSTDLNWVELLFLSSLDKWSLSLRFSVRKRLELWSNLSLWQMRKGFPQSWSNIVCVSEATRILKYKPMYKCLDTEILSKISNTWI